MTRRSFSTDFKLEAASLVLDQGYSIPEACKSIGVGPTALRRWVEQLRKEQCVHRQRFESLQHASRAIGDWIQFYNHQRPHQALTMKTPAEAYALAV